MSRRLWIISVIVIIAVVAVIALSFVALFTQKTALSVVVIICIALAVVALQYLVVNPAVLENAKRSAKKYCDAGQIIDPGLHKRLCDRLSSAKDDHEAVHLQERLKNLQDKSKKESK